MNPLSLLLTSAGFQTFFDSPAKTSLFLLYSHALFLLPNALFTLPGLHSTEIAFVEMTNDPYAPKTQSHCWVSTLAPPPA